MPVESFMRKELPDTIWKEIQSQGRQSIKWKEFYLLQYMFTCCFSFAVLSWSFSVFQLKICKQRFLCLSIRSNILSQHIVLLSIVGNILHFQLVFQELNLFVRWWMHFFYQPLSFLLSPLLLSVSLGSHQGKKASTSHSVILSCLPTAPPATFSPLIHHRIAVQNVMDVCVCVCMSHKDIHVASHSTCSSASLLKGEHTFKFLNRCVEYSQPDRPKPILFVFSKAMETIQQERFDEFGYTYIAPR